jgi:hypothetical protein
LSAAWLERELGVEKPVNLAEMPTLHGYKSVTPDHHGEFRFAVLNLMKSVEQAHQFPGQNKFPQLKDWDEEERRTFLLNSGKLRDTFWKADRLLELVDDTRQKFVDFQPPSTTAQLIAQNRKADIDFRLFLDALLLYWKIFADTLAKLTAQLPCFKKNQVKGDTFRLQRDWFLNKKRSADEQYASLLETHTEWFGILAGDNHGEGLRDKIVHQPVRTEIVAYAAENPAENMVAAIMYGTDPHRVTSLVPSIQDLLFGLFTFLDDYTVHFVRRIEEAIGGKLPGLEGRTLSLFYETEKELPAAWLYPKIDG